jgi:hypothetical protein
VEKRALTEAEKAHLREQGWVVLPALVPREAVDAALKAINASLGAGIDPREMATFRSQSFCPELRESAVIGDLYDATPVRPIVESLLGANAVYRHERAQIALRFPSPRPSGAPPPPPDPHIDGFHTAENGVARGRIATFSGLIGVFLSDTPDEYAANFTVWPGTHLAFARHFREHPPHPDLPNGIPPIPLPAPLQLRAKTGDVVLAHYQLAHTASINLSSHVRYAVYFRFQRKDHAARGLDVMRDPWGEWEGMAAAG